MKIILTAALLTLANLTPARAVTPIHEACDSGHELACMELAYRTGGQCASPGGLGGCAYDSRFIY